MAVDISWRDEPPEVAAAYAAVDTARAVGDHHLATYWIAEWARLRHDLGCKRAYSLGHFQDLVDYAERLGMTVAAPVPVGPSWDDLPIVMVGGSCCVDDQSPEYLACRAAWEPLLLADPGLDGIPRYKLMQCDGYVVSPREIAAALAKPPSKQLRQHRGAPDCWGEFIGMLETAAMHGGLLVQ